MDQPKYINKNLKPGNAMDFMFLRTEGIRKIQELTGAFWTDYNLHDPGVTILEQLCYAITDLAYRVDSDIEEHLFSAEKANLPFFRPEETLTNSPITIEDFRKLLIDTIPEIKNIWFEPVKQFESGFNGLYRILVDISEYGLNREENIDVIKEKVKGVFSQFRNLAEDIYEINILEELPVKVHADIETDGIHELEKILSKIYFEIEQLMAPEVKFYSLNELVKKGLSYHEIFNGPRLKHGFILSEDLIPQQNSIIISDIVRSIMQIEGIVSVKQLSIEVNGEIHTSQMVIPEGKIPRIITTDLFSGSVNNISTIHFYKGSLEYSGLNHKNFMRYLNELVSENKKAFRISQSSFEIPTDVGGMDFSQYYSIQNHFPAIYGVGPEGIPGRPDTKRIAQSKQLKAYLLIFEQFMANYLSQLAHFKDLLSIHKKQEQTYFTQPLNVVPNVDELFANEKGNISDAYLELESIPKNYQDGLNMLNKLFDNYTDRRNRFLDFLLATHGESLTQYALQQFNFYYTDEEFDEYLIRCKTALLQVLGELNYIRSTGLDYKNSNTQSLSGLEKRLAIFLGFGINETTEGKIEILTNSDSEKLSKQSNINIVGSKGFAKFRNRWLKDGGIKKYQIENHDIENKFDFIDDVDLNKITVKQEEVEDVIVDLLPFKTKLIYKEYLTTGIILSNYKIGKVSKPESLYLLTYNFSGQGDWVAIGEFKKKEDALKAVKTLISQLTEININSEYVTMVEHILLRPAPELEMYGIYINDENGKHILKSNKQFNLKRRTEIIKEIEKYFLKAKAFDVEADENRDMNIVFDIKELDIRFSSIEPKSSVEETHKQKEQLFEFLSGKTGDKDTSKKVGFYIQYAQDKVDIPEEFYSFQLSLIFPDLSARFQNHEFRAIAHDIILEQKPANIYANINWLEPEDLIVFNKLFNSWRKSLASEEDSNHEIVSQLAEFLYIKMHADV